MNLKYISVESHSSLDTFSVVSRTGACTRTHTHARPLDKAQIDSRVLCTTAHSSLLTTTSPAAKLKIQCMSHAAALRNKN